MNEYNHLKTYKLELITKSPVFIGSGIEYNKKEFYYDKERNQVHILNIPAMLSMLSHKGLIDEYERYMLHTNSNEDLRQLFTSYNISREELNSLTKYTVSVGDALNENGPLASINQCIRDPYGNPYIPGSSLKGCLRTAILWKLISIDKKRLDEYTKTKNFEALYLNTLMLNEKKPLLESNSILRGLSVSDSEPLNPKHVILTKKIDMKTNGVPKEINTIREAIAPRTSIHFILTMDESINTNLNIDSLMDCIHMYGNYYFDTYLSSFHQPSNMVKENFNNCIVLGGGSGYFGKNIMYPLLGKEEAVKQVSAIMAKKFRKHNHENDEEISPHTLKMTRYMDSLYQYGVCEVRIRRTYD